MNVNTVTTEAETTWSSSDWSQPHHSDPGSEDGVPLEAFTDMLTEDEAMTKDLLEDDACETEQGTLIVHLSETKCRLTLLHENGTLQPLQNDQENDIYYIPLQIGLIRKKVFVFGNSVEYYINAAKDDTSFAEHLLYWDLGSTLIQTTSKKAEVFVYNHRLVPVKAELLLGLFLHYLRKLALTRLNTGLKHVEIKRVIFAVPLWFTSYHRQRLKDVAEMARFEDSTVVNATSLLALLHISSKKLHPETPMKLLVLSENSGNVDLAFYTCEAGVGVKMLACTGNQYDSVGDWDSYYARKLVKEVYETVKGAEKSGKNDGKHNLKPNSRKSLLTSLLLELEEKLPHETIPGTLNDVLCFCEDDEWKVLFEELMKTGVVSYDHLGAPPLITEPNWHPPVVLYEHLCKDDMIVDLIPYDAFRNTATLVKWDGKLFEKDTVSRDGTHIKYILDYPMTRFKVYQKSLLIKEMPILFEVGTVNIKRILYFQYPKMEIQLTLGREGIIRMDSVYVCNESGDRQFELENSNAGYLWEPGNLSEREKDMFSRDLLELIQMSEQYMQDVSSVREVLWGICHKISEGLWEETYSKILEPKAVVKLQAKVNNNLNKLRNSTTRPLIEIGKGGLEKLLKHMKKHII